MKRADLNGVKTAVEGTEKGPLVILSKTPSKQQCVAATRLSRQCVLSQRGTRSSERSDISTALHKANVREKVSADSHCICQRQSHQPASDEDGVVQV